MLVRKTIFGIAILFLLGAGCNSNLIGSSISGLNGGSGAGGGLVSGKSSENFCSKQRTDAENKIKNFKTNDRDNKVLQLWKENFLRSNGLDEKYFSQHVFVSEIRSFSKSANNLVIYYLKLGDVYLDWSAGDEVIIIPSSTGYFNSADLATLSKDKMSEKSLEKDTHPTFGRVPSTYFINYSWGTVVASNIRSYSSKILSCDQGLAVLRGCRGDMNPVDLVFRPSLGIAYIQGFAGNRGSPIKNCASGSADLFNMKIMSCNLDIKCDGNMAF